MVWVSIGACTGVSSLGQRANRRREVLVFRVGIIFLVCLFVVLVRTGATMLNIRGSSSRFPFDTPATEQIMLLEICVDNSVRYMIQYIGVIQ